MPKPRLDLLVFGATSFAGRLLAAYLAEDFNGKKVFDERLIDRLVRDAGLTFGPE